MLSRSIKAIGCLIVLGMICLFQPTVHAAALGPTFTVTDLGTGYTLNQGTDSKIQSLTNSDGQYTYAFTKSPVARIHQEIDNNNNTFTGYVLQIGDHKAGHFIFPSQGVSVPTGYANGSDWKVSAGLEPVSDLNAQGQMVGMGVHSTLSSGPTNQFAAFSMADGSPHPFSTLTNYTDDLNAYLANGQGIYLTSAVKIDDLGRIIADGTLDGKAQEFLLTPNGLSTAPLATPEPSSLCIMTVLTGIYLATKYRSHEARNGARNGVNSVFRRLTKSKN